MNGYTLHEWKQIESLDMTRIGEINGTWLGGEHLLVGGIGIGTAPIFYKDERVIIGPIPHIKLTHARGIFRPRTLYS